MYDIIKVIYKGNVVEVQGQMYFILKSHYSICILAHALHWEQLNH